MMYSSKNIRCFVVSVGFISSISLSGIQAQTPPVQPKVQEVPMPPAVELPAPPNVQKDVTNKPLTVEEAISIALKYQPDITVARTVIEAAQGRVKQTRSDLLPLVNVGTSYANRVFSSSGGTVVVNSATGYQVSATISQLIFDFNHTRDLVRQAAAQQTAAKANLSRTESDVILAVKLAFYTYMENQRLMAVNEANLQNQQNHLDSTRARLDDGVGLPADVVRAETAVANASYGLTQAQTDATGARIQLAQLMGIDPRTPIETAESSEPALKDENLTTLVDTALKQRPEIVQNQANIQAANYGLKAAKTTDYPAVSVNSGWLQRGTAFPPDSGAVTYGIGLQWSPFDGGYAKGKVEEARANMTSQQAQFESLKLQVTSEVSQAYLRVKSAEQKIPTADAEVANAEQALELMEGRYRSGLGTFLDVLDAQTALLTARTNRVNAQSALNQARAVLAQAVGVTAGNG